MSLRSFGPLGQSLDAVEAFCGRLGWDAHVKAAQRRMLRPSRDTLMRRILDIPVYLPTKWYLYP